MAEVAFFISGLEDAQVLHNTLTRPVCNEAMSTAAPPPLKES